jgi:broad specificity phosphatase PhoE
VRRLLLVRHAPTLASERGAFAADEPVTDAGAAAAAELRAALPGADVALSSPALRCRQTAAALGLEPALVPELAECRFGAWEGRTFAEINQREPELVGGWLRDPDAAPPGGESLSRFAERVSGWLAGLSAQSAETVLAVTHAGVIRAAAIAAIGAPIQGFWRLAVVPLSVTELRSHDGDWTLSRLGWTVAL